MGVASSAPSTSGGDRALLMRHEIYQDLAKVRRANDRPNRDANHTVLAIAPLLVTAATVLTPFSGISPLIAEIQERTEVAVGHQDDIAPFASIAAVRPPFGHVFLSAETDAATPSITCPDEDFGFIDEHQRSM
jgi:hypothetical protein